MEIAITINRVQKTNRFVLGSYIDFSCRGPCYANIRSSGSSGSNIFLDVGGRTSSPLKGDASAEQVNTINNIYSYVVYLCGFTYCSSI